MVWISKTSYETLLEEMADHFPNETGGVLMGYWGETNTNAVITNIIGPGPHAIHESTRFVPDHNYHLRQIAITYESSGRRWTYLGDWHVHPEGSIRLSRVDKRTLRRIALYEPARAPIPLMLLIGGKLKAPTMEIYVLGRMRVAYLNFRRFRKTAVKHFDD